MKNEKVIEFVGNSGKFAKVPRRIFDDDVEIKTTDIAVLACLSSYADNETNTSFPRVNLIAEKLGVSKRTVQRSFIALERERLISIVRRKDKYGGNMSNLYQINYI